MEYIRPPINAKHEIDILFVRGMWMSHVSYVMHALLVVKGSRQLLDDWLMDTIDKTPLHYVTTFGTHFTLEPSITVLLSGHILTSDVFYGIHYILIKLQNECS